MKTRPALLVFLTMLILACASPSKNFEKGNFEKAYLGLLKEFEKGNTSRKDRSIFNKSFSEMLSQNTTDRELTFRDTDIDDYEYLYNDSERLIINYVKGKRWLDNKFDDPMRIIEQEQDSLARDIADFYWQEADTYMNAYYNSGNKEEAREAFQAYEKVYNYSGSNALLDSLSAVARSEATTFILIESKAWDFDLEWIIDRRFDEIEGRSRKFTAVAYEEYLDVVDCHIFLEFGALDIDLSERVQTDNYSKEIIASYETYRDSLGNKYERPIYETVKASVECAISTKTYFWEARANIDPANNYCDFRPRRFGSDFVIESKSFITRGDERALPDEMRDLVNVGFARKEESIITDLIEDIYRQFEREYF